MSDAYGFNSGDVARINRSVRTTEKLAPPTLGGKSDGAPGIAGGVWVKLGTEDSSHHGHYQWTMETVSTGTFTSGSTTSGDNYTAYEINSTSGLSGKYAKGFPGGQDDSGNNIFLFGYGPPTFVPVTVAQSGGSAGNLTTMCSFTYSWTDPAGSSHSGSTPIWNSRLSIGKMVAATHGDAHFNATSSVWELYRVDEMPAATGCS